jgi:hypothetical protein
MGVRVLLRVGVLVLGPVVRVLLGDLLDSVAEAVRVALPITAGVLVLVFVGKCVAVSVGVLIAVCVGMVVAVFGGVLVAVLVGVGIAVLVGMAVAVAVRVGVAVLGIAVGMVTPLFGG